MGMKEKSPKQDLSSAKDLTIELPKGRESSNHTNQPNQKREETTSEQGYLVV